MKISEAEVRYVAALANLSLTDAEVHKFQAELDGILEHMARLNEIDTADVEPMAQVLYDAEETATLRADVPAPPLGNAAALANAPQAGAGYFKVPQVIER
ncbi:MAG TPA: Asp-tRNA(Asn)/Glu-tRNA(Gln) amidotransferase subunit GatC [Terriglobia bacterium]|nr:Asp-tRNA(Asn)/Glu-tRNA(Gln) amidotransferase subunit GatC [Terriglobia bacterium]